MTARPPTKIMPTGKPEKPLCESLLPTIPTRLPIASAS